MTVRTQSPTFSRWSHWPLNRLFSAITTTVLVFLALVLVLGVRQYLLYHQCRDAVTSSDRLLFQFTAIPARGGDPLLDSLAACREAQRVVIIPGYGMARAQAQFEVVALARQLTDMGKDVRFAIHPVAGRMPGHMHVLLAEADVSYDRLYELKDINPEFSNTDVVIVVGACDVVNPAALTVADCPISGMPILLANEAGRVLVCNMDDKPGYSGVENPLYRSPSTTLLLGDARETINHLAAGLRGEGAAA